ncbi:MAG: calcium-binding protein [Methylovulum sp.]|nr:calcium-binding protein [Methylovulum sp.]
MAIKLGTTGNDTVTGTAGWDMLYGLAGNDTLSGGGGPDILSGGEGKDILEGGAGADSLHGGNGADVFLYANFNHASGDKIVDFSAGDTINFSAIAGAKFIGNAQFTGVAGEIRYGSGYGSYSGYYNNNAFIAIDTDGDAVANVSLQFVGQINFEETAAGSQILSAAIDQILNGTNAGEKLTGGAGNDTLSGLSGNDTLIGGDSHDVLFGGDGNDILDGGLGADTLAGGGGADTFRFTKPDDFSLNGGDSINDFGGGDQIAVAFQGASYIGDAPFSGVPGQYRVSGDNVAFDFDGDKTSDSMITLDNLGSSRIGLEESVPGSNSLTIAPNKTLTGTAANNTLTGGNGYDMLIGDTGNDKLAGGAFGDTLEGGDGADTLVGGSGADTLTGGAGNDIFKFNALAELGDNSYLPSGGYVRDTVTDLAVGDQINLSAIAELKFVGVGNSFSGVANQVRVYDDYNATLLQIDTNGDKNADYSLVLPDSLTVEETAAGSLVFQVAENKVLNGTAANNTLIGGNGNDTLNGDAGNDVLVGGYGADTLTGGLGNDTFKYKSLVEVGNGAYLPSGGYNRDTVTDLAVGDNINLSAIAGLVFVGVGNDFSGEANQVRVYDDYNATLLQIDTNGDKNADYSLALPDNLTVEETATGSQVFQVAENKLLNGTTANNTLTGGNGNDMLDGNAGKDVLVGGYGADTLVGGDGADTLDGGLGLDTLTGGLDNDTFKYNSLAEIGNGTYINGAYNRDTVTDLAVGDNINLSAIAGLAFVGVGNDFSGEANQVRIYDDYNATLLQIDTTGDKNADYSLALPDNLTVEETATGSQVFQVTENKLLNGTTANNTLTGGNGNDTLDGNAGNDVLAGSYGSDTLNGGDGADTLVGGLGIDTLTGGAGNDVFKYNALTEFGSQYYGDTITDLTTGDKINLSAIDANPQQTGDQAFTFVGENSFTGLAGELRYSFGTLYGDVNGDMSSDFALILSGAFVPGASSFIL